MVCNILVEVSFYIGNASVYKTDGQSNQHRAEWFWYVALVNASETYTNITRLYPAAIRLQIVFCETFYSENIRRKDRSIEELHCSFGFYFKQKHSFSYLLFDNFKHLILMKYCQE